MMAKNKQEKMYKNRFCPNEFSKLLHRTKELREFSVMSMSQIWDKCVTHEFFDEFEDGSGKNFTDLHLNEIKEDDEGSIENPQPLLHQSTDEKPP
jgi:hypothetical protein